MKFQRETSDRNAEVSKKLPRASSKILEPPLPFQEYKKRYGVQKRFLWRELLPCHEPHPVSRRVGENFLLLKRSISWFGPAAVPVSQILCGSTLPVHLGSLHNGPKTLLPHPRSPLSFVLLSQLPHHSPAADLPT